MNEPTMNEPTQELPEPAQQLRELSIGGTAADALAFFDSLAPVRIDEVLGSWHGAELRTGHPLDGVLSSLGWHGKRFGGPDDAHPLVFEADGGRLFDVNPSLVPLPLPLALRLGSLLGSARAGRIIRPLLRLARTDKPRARLRMTEYRGVLSATMIYDALPVNDAFRQVDADTLLGAMDVRGSRPPYIFALHRSA